METIEQIVSAYRVTCRYACPAIVAKTYYVCPNTGARYTAMGGFPRGLSPDDCTTQIRYVYTDGRTTWAHEDYYTEFAARQAWEIGQDANEAEFRAALESMPIDRLIEQHAYWTSKAARAAK